MVFVRWADLVGRTVSIKEEKLKNLLLANVQQNFLSELAKAGQLQKDIPPPPHVPPIASYKSG